MKKYKTALTLRGDKYYCPLALQLSTYWNCENNCAHCYLRRLNRTWGKDLRPLDTSILRKQIGNSDRKGEIKTPLDHAIRQRKTIYFGAKSDPYQHAEKEHGVSREALEILFEYGFSVVIATKFTENLWEDLFLFEENQDKVIFMPIISPGWEKDWEILERQGTTPPEIRFSDVLELKERGFQVGINGEPFIAGFHTIEDFERTLIRIKEAGLNSYNIYNLHFNDHNAKEMWKVGIDIEKVWEGNQDEQWNKTLSKMIELSKKYGINLGCPDFINSGDYTEKTNTCCGINVPNPTTFNLIHWKKLKLKGLADEEILKETWDGVGVYEEGRKLIKGENKDMYSLKDIKKEKDYLL